MPLPDESFTRFGKLSTPAYLWFASVPNSENKPITDIRVLYDDEKPGQRAVA